MNRNRLGLPKVVVNGGSLDDIELSTKSIKENIDLNLEKEEKDKENILPSQKVIQRKLDKWCKERNINLDKCVD